MKNFWKKAQKAMAPTDLDLAMEKAEKFVQSLTSAYTVEEQSQAILQVKVLLKQHRRQEIEKTEEYLARLKKDLLLLDATDNIVEVSKEVSKEGAGTEDPDTRAVPSLS